MKGEIVQFPNLPEWFKITTTHFAAVAIVCGLVLFGPQPFLTAVGVAGFVNQYRMWVGFVFLLCAVIVLARATTAVVKRVEGNYIQAKPQEVEATPSHTDA